ncbi:MAG: hypothetical protein IH944_13205 [Armatimonadetes bacterium]|nr:hypothetical protein [Armatimonadota bacterium]
MVTDNRAVTYAVASLVLGIMSFMGGVMLTGIPAWILGKVAIKEVDAGHGTEADRQMGRIGVILGKLAVLISVVCIVIAVVAAVYYGFTLRRNLKIGF